VRGNVDTRLRKLDEGDFDAIILASAGLHRLGYKERITEHLSERLVLPAVGQGALAIETRTGDASVNEIVGPLNHRATRLACAAERAFLQGLGGGCLVPIAAHARIDGAEMTIAGLVASPDGAEMIRDEMGGVPGEAESIGRRLAEAMIKRGADRILAQK
jgi:hydroxymethylbilane synthase